MVSGGCSQKEVCVLWSKVLKMKAVHCSILLLLLALHGGVVRADEDCVEGEEGCEAESSSQPTVQVEKQNDIYILTDENFGEVVKKEEMIMATFYAPWCVTLRPT